MAVPQPQTEPRNAVRADRLVFVLTPGQPVRLRVRRRRPTREGWGKPRKLPKRDSLGEWVADAVDRRVLAPLLGHLALEGREVPADRALPLPAELARDVLTVAAGAGRCLLGERTLRPDPNPRPWRLGAEVRPGTLRWFLARGEARRPLRSCLAIGDVAIVDGALADLDRAGANLSAEASDDPLETVARIGGRPVLDLPPGQALLDAAPVPVLVASAARTEDDDDDEAQVGPRLELWFEYAGQRVGRGDDALVPTERGPLRRDPVAEATARRRLVEASGVAPGRRLPSKRLPALARALIAEGWKVEADGRAILQATGVALRVRAERDWFELRGRIRFPQGEVELPELLRALREGRPLELPDGSLGLVDAEWGRRAQLLDALLDGSKGAQSDALRFRPEQTWLVEPLLFDDEAEEEPKDPATPRPKPAKATVEVDDRYAQARRALADFDGVRPRPEPPGFLGTLRPYQRQALGWFAFLRDFGFGGCLADDMGLGKTVQVLALLQERKLGGKKPPSLVVAPSSLVGNWVREARKFALDLTVASYLGPNRRWPAQADVVVTSYGILRRDIDRLAERRLDYAILDEAQAIKNPASRRAKAACRLQADHRLALSGTPIENHLGELASLFRFLNPGLLGKTQTLRKLDRAGDLDPEGRALLARSLRPFFLRRTKAEVLGDLPPKHEQVLRVALPPAQRALYDELLDHYRAALLGLAPEGQERPNVLSALLRLRQVACHPALLDPAMVDDGSAKLEVLRHRLLELRARGEKALVFSQFTRLLDLVRHDLRQAGIETLTLSGKTPVRDRQKRVDRFQDDPDAGVFLISLKAGGVGLNLTAADAVFLLDPWWNPAAEAQAVDRAHRFGREKPVFAYRLIAEETVEEKIAALQRTKRELAAALVGAAAGPSTGGITLSRDDLAQLLA